MFFGKKKKRRLPVGWAAARFFSSGHGLQAGDTNRSSNKTTINYAKRRIPSVKATHLQGTNRRSTDTSYALYAARLQKNNTGSYHGRCVYKLKKPETRVRNQSRGVYKLKPLPCAGHGTLTRSVCKAVVYTPS